MDHASDEAVRQVQPKPSIVCIGILVLAATLWVGETAFSSSSSSLVSELAFSAQDEARLAVEAGIHVYAVGAVRAGLLGYEHITMSTYTASLALNHSDRLEWGLSLTHAPQAGLTTLGATARIRLGREVSAVLGATKPLSQQAGQDLAWDAHLEWQRVLDPLALSARVGWIASSGTVPGVISIGGSIGLLVNDHVSLSGRTSIARQTDGVVSSNVGTSLACRVSALDTMYVKLDASLVPAESMSITVGLLRELKRATETTQ